MNWVLKKSKKFSFHTDLREVTFPFKEEIQKFNWLISDLAFIKGDLVSIPLNYEQDYFLLSPEQFLNLALTDTQIIWGAILAIPTEIELRLNDEDLPYVEGNEKIWNDGNIQLNEAVIEIDCYDSSFTIVKFKSTILSDKFREYFPEAIGLSKFRSKY
ncbi:MAG: hypothetical protein WCF67_17355 [Chitinophagaceae bacterium]